MPKGAKMEPNKQNLHFGYQIGSTGRQNVQGHRFCVFNAFLHLQLRGFANISPTRFDIEKQKVKWAISKMCNPEQNPTSYWIAVVFQSENIEFRGIFKF